MDSPDVHWKRLDRETLLNSPYMQVWQDIVELPSGEIINDYSVASLPNGVIVVATDENANLIMFNEYKYAVDTTILSFPAGGIDGDESPIEAAARELLEETGYQSTEFEQLAALFVHPSKIKHIDYIVRAKNATQVKNVEHESTEMIGSIQLVPINRIKELREEGKFNTTYLLSAIALAFPESLI